MRLSARLSDFFMGKLYPVVLAVLVTVGHLFKCEMITATVIVMLLAVQCCFCDSIRPAFFLVVTFTFQIPLEHSPAYNASDYYFTGWRLTVVVILAVIVAASVITFVVRRALWRRLSIKHTKIFPALLVLAVAFLTNGIFSETWSVRGFIFGAAEAAFFLFLTLLFYLGISEKESEFDLLDYVSYIALIIALVILVQMADLFIFGDAIQNGAIQKGNVNLGWATCNPLGSILLPLIPALFYGAMTKRNGWLYFIVASAVYFAAICTCSRNALLFGTLIYLLCLLVALVVPSELKTRLIFAAIIVAGLAVLAAAFFLFFDEIKLFFRSYVNQGASDSGRFGIWKMAWRQFLDNIAFGAGFFTSDASGVHVVVSGVPTMVHNTPLEFLSAGGVFGFLAYMYYRAETIRPMLHKPTLGKLMLGLSHLVLVAQGLLDVFVLSFYTMFFPMVALAVVLRIYEMQTEDSYKFAPINDSFRM